MVNQQTTEQATLALQRESAIKFRGRWPEAETIRFTREGHRPGPTAPWSVNAVATVAGTEYLVIIGPGIPANFLTGDVPPDSSAESATSPLTVIFSDGTSEVIE